MVASAMPTAAVGGDVGKIPAMALVMASAVDSGGISDSHSSSWGVREEDSHGVIGNVRGGRRRLWVMRGVSK